MFRDRGSVRALCVAVALALATAPLRAHADLPSPSPSPSPVAEQPSGTTPPPPPETTTTLVPIPVPAPTLAPAPSPVSSATTPIVLKKRPHPGLLGGGLVLFVGGWVGDIAFTYGYDHQPAWTSLIPIAGAFIQLTQDYGLEGPPVNSGNPEVDRRIERNVDNANSTIRGLALAGAAISGVCQLAGVALIIAGAALKGRRVQRFASGSPGGPYGFRLSF